MPTTGSNGTAATPRKPSPDSVIDLTDARTNTQDYFRSSRKGRRLGSVRKELEPPSAKKRGRAGLKTTGLEDANMEEVIVIDSDDDDDFVPIDNDDDDCEIIEVENPGAAVASRSEVASRPAKRAKSKGDEISPLVVVKKELEKKAPDMTNIEGVEVVEAAAPVLAAATMVSKQAKNNSGDDDVVVEGVLNETRLPHMRQHCTRCPFTATRWGSKSNFSIVSQANSESCDLCYCYVCDVPVKECKHWHSTTSNAPEDNHCMATEKDKGWERMRARAKKKDQAATSRSAFESYRTNDDYRDTDDDSDDYDDHDHYGGYYDDEDDDEPNESDDENPLIHLPRMLYQQWREQSEMRRNSTYGRAGPFKPDHPDAPRNKELTQCRHCSWFSKLTNHRLYPSSDDWCHNCGRVASKKDLEKQQLTYTDSTSEENDGSYFLGEKEIPFRIKAHDPRLFEKYKLNWEKGDSGSPEWRYDDAEREEEVFLHRIGKSPGLSNILSAIPEVTNENIPNKPQPRVSGNTRDTTDAIVIEDKKQLQFVTSIISIMETLHSNGPMEVTASYVKETRSGVLKFRLKQPRSAFAQSFASHWLGLSPQEVTVILGLWYGQLPLKPSEICGRLNGWSSEEIIENLELQNATYDIHVDPYRVEQDDVLDAYREKLPSRVGNLLSAKDVYNSRLTMASSDGNRLSGGVCPRASSNSFRDSIVRYFFEQFPSLVNRRLFDSRRELVASCFGATRRKRFVILDAILGYPTSVAAESSFQIDAEKRAKLYRYNPSIKDVMIQVENLGHESEDCVKGLKIKLLDFQRQSLKWALERERTPGGIQSFFWPKLPTSTGQEDLYYNPLLKAFRKDKPALVRGGIIAEQMGLGKTVISLALILKNPAPTLPLNGSPILELKKKDPNNAASGNCFWDQNVYEKTSISNKKTGSIICRGTLVICPVSLVGQWIDEARSKLEDPGLIYPYHGHNRKRDPKILAANSIVVTTYDILASDAFRRTKKSIEPGYCPPLQQIRWWRIICDEGHLLRERNSCRSKAVLSLVADNKWIVTGTPMNTSISDLKNQVRFLGFEYVEKLFAALLISNVCHKGNSIEMDRMMYFLRPIMMRHSQEQKYRGTSTTLMSLPPKTEREEKVALSKSEKKEYKLIEKEAQDWYIKFRSKNRNDISKNFLKISSKLNPIRIACSGGKYPIYLDELGEEDGSARVRKYSDFVFESKFKTLLAKLEKIRDTEPDSKSLVFSQFSSTLDWLKIELPKHGFQFRTLSGDMTMKKRAKALSDFQNDPPTTIFLLSMRSGAVGINLTQANRVFLMEPSFNPALEAQAIGRVHRLGQKRKVEILKLVVKDSFEERMIKFLKKKYGKKSEKKSQGESDDGDEKDSSDEKVDAQVGNLNSDKVRLVTEEFDTLFGVKARLRAEGIEGSGDGSQSEGGNDNIKADRIKSMENI